MTLMWEQCECPRQTSPQL